MHLSTETNKKRLTNQEIKKALHEEGPLRIKEFVYEGQSVRELILLFGEYSWKYPTYDKNGRQQCAASRNRSFCDIYAFILGVRPNITVRTVKQEIAKLIIEAKIQPAECPQIRRGTLLFPGTNASGKIAKDDYKGRLTKFTEFGCNMGEFYEIN